jgi:hypothetical protein
MNGEEFTYSKARLCNRGLFLLLAVYLTKLLVAQTFNISEWITMNDELKRMSYEFKELP